MTPHQHGPKPSAVRAQSEPSYLDDDRPDLAGLSPEIASILLNVAEPGEERDSIAAILAMVKAQDELPPAVADLLTLASTIEPDESFDDESWIRRDSLQSYVKRGDNYVAEWDGLTATIPATVQSANPIQKYHGSVEAVQKSVLYGTNIWAFSHKLFLEHLSRVIWAKAECAEPGEELTIRYCVNCGRSACPFNGPYAYIRVKVH